jgi:hypothetical protein
VRDSVLVMLNKKKFLKDGRNILYSSCILRAENGEGKYTLKCLFSRTYMSGMDGKSFAVFFGIDLLS